MQSVAKVTGAFSAAGQGFGQRLERELGLLLPFRPAQVADDDDLGALLGQLAQGRQGPVDAGCVGDLAVLHRHVEVDADKDPLAGNVETVDRPEFAHGGSSLCPYASCIAAGQRAVCAATVCEAVLCLRPCSSFHARRRVARHGCAAPRAVRRTLYAKSSVKRQVLPEARHQAVMPFHRHRRLQGSAVRAHRSGPERYGTISPLRSGLSLRRRRVRADAAEHRPRGGRPTRSSSGRSGSLPDCRSRSTKRTGWAVGRKPIRPPIGRHIL